MRIGVKQQVFKNTELVGAQQAAGYQLGINALRP